VRWAGNRYADAKGNVVVSIGGVAVAVFAYRAGGGAEVPAHDRGRGMSAPVDVLAVLGGHASGLRDVSASKAKLSPKAIGNIAEDLARVNIALADLIETLHTRRMELGRRGGNTLLSPLRAEWEFLGIVLARVGGAA
jgi:hypothetical protein